MAKRNINQKRKKERILRFSAGSLVVILAFLSIILFPKTAGSINTDAAGINREVSDSSQESVLFMDIAAEALNSNNVFDILKICTAMKSKVLSKAGEANMSEPQGPGETDPSVLHINDAGETGADSADDSDSSENMSDRFSNTESYLLVANKKHKLPENYAPSDLEPPKVRMNYAITMRDEAAEALSEMFNDAEDEGVYLVLGSGFRSQDSQRTIYNDYASRRGAEAADTFSSRPGYSDHQTGLAADISDFSGETYLSREFENTAEGQWLFQNAYKYGFILRYPKGKDDITGYMYEPWHYRYIGREEAEKFNEANTDGTLTFEEFYGVEGGYY